MLILSRKKNETIRIAADITITVAEIRGDRVRLGIDAPREIPVHRGEIAAAIEAQAPPGFKLGARGEGRGASDAQAMPEPFPLSPD